MSKAAISVNAISCHAMPHMVTLIPLKYLHEIGNPFQWILSQTFQHHTDMTHYWLLWINFQTSSFHSNNKVPQCTRPCPALCYFSIQTPWPTIQHHFGQRDCFHFFILERTHVSIRHSTQTINCIPSADRWPN